MSATPNLDLHEQLARIDRAIAATHRRQAESDKFAAEARKLRREYVLSPILALVAVIGGVLGVASLILHVIGRGSFLSQAEHDRRDYALGRHVTDGMVLD